MNCFSCFFITITLLGCSRKISTKALSPAPGDSATAIVSTAAVGQKTPSCILMRIESIKKEHVWNPPGEVYEYEYQSKKVYTISSDCCDRFTTVVDADCNYICAPSGGFTGRGDGKCTDFFKEAKRLRLVWKDERAENKKRL
ncbi:hypothetical protein [Segetibacter sp.]|jgi:hypothetical protein|uniref:DUF6970 domain-containing protein n=1 Tax=Segetibacter sp. TaxID=2231182 RepID=UPI0026086583|nr:hypothetical protein [Segetibacter sp.]MCW3082127.1 hypothetical protein [Segetibacter sp.]